jgi:N-acetylmuramoyl-L-alanine amidase
MGVFFQRKNRFGCAVVCAVVWIGLSAVGFAASVKRPVRMSPWDAAVAARERFEDEPAGTHTKAEYTEVMDRFRSIYHNDPADAHAARAVEQVAELLVEQGSELKDKKSVKDGVAQYQFLAKAYPAYAKSAQRALAARPLEETVVVRRGATRAAVVGEGEEAKRRSPEGMTNKREAEAEVAVVRPAVGKPVVGEATAHDARAGDVAADEAKAMPVVTGIRHWSTPTYTRVAIDLGDDNDQDVKYEAARVVGPDRLFFDLHHVKLAPGLVGKTFSITDDGFLTKIRAAKAGDDVIRVVLDVHQVGEYSAFLLPNPERLIIDIHGKAASSDEGVASKGRSAADEVATTNAAEVAVAAPDVAVAAPVARRAGSSGISRPEDIVTVAETPRTVEAPAAVTPRPTPAPIERAEPASGVEVSSLPPMPVTDGSAGFGLPLKSTRSAAVAQPVARSVAPPRVVIPVKSTVARPVPNTVTKSSENTGGEVAAVSLQPGKVEATRRPTSHPVSSGNAESAGVNGDHYVPRSRRKAAVAVDATTDAAAVPMAHVSGEPVVAAPPTADGETLVRALGLKIGRIVIDAGHGGHDSGTLGVGGIQEKDVVLDVALRLGKLLHDRLGAEIVYTRADDTFIPLETRTAIANKAQADLFISVHANSSQEPSARGVEVYYLNFTSDPDAMSVASRENAVSTQSVHELSDLVKKIALKDKIEESKELAGDVDASLYAGLAKGNEGLRDRGVKKAPFVVLIGANMPSILAEISFVTNPEDAEKLETPEYRERVAESLYEGVAKYAAGVNGFSPKKKVKVERAAR